MGNTFSSLYWNKSEAARLAMTPQLQAPSNTTSLRANESWRESQYGGQTVVRTSRYVRESIMSSFLYCWGRQNGTKDAETVLRRQHEDSDCEVMAGHIQELDAKKKEVDKVKVGHRAELASVTLSAKRQIDMARMATRRSQDALQQERQKMDKKLKAAMRQHKAEKELMRAEYKAKVGYLQDKLDKLARHLGQDPDKLSEPERDQDQAIRWTISHAIRSTRNTKLSWKNCRGMSMLSKKNYN